MLLRIDIKSGLGGLLEFIKKIKKFKIGISELEIEFTEQIKKIGKELEEAKESITIDYKLPESAILNVDEIIHEASKDPRAAFLLLSAKIEGKVRERLHEAGIEEKDRFIPLSDMVEFGIHSGVFPKELLPSFRDFWAIRNRVVHGKAFEVEDSVIYSLISLGNEILKWLSIERTWAEFRGIELGVPTP